MNMMKHAVLLTCCVALTACANDRRVGLVQADFGNAVRQNIAGATVNPMAPMDRAPLTMNGQRAERQQQRYVADMVEKPVEIGTQTTGSGGSGGGGGGGGGSGGGSSAGAGAGAAP
jgi:uncharacterized membrane protein YgcG